MERKKESAATVSSVLLLVLVLCVSFPSTFAAFGDRIRPIVVTPHPVFFTSNSSSPTTPAPTHVLVTQASLADGSPEPGDDGVAGTTIDALLHDHELSEEEVKQMAGEEEEDELNLPDGKEPAELTADGNAVREEEEEEAGESSSSGDGKSDRMLDEDIYPLEPPQLLSGTNDSISSADTYSRFRYAIPPVVNPHNKNQVVFLSNLSPREGHHHESGRPVRKVYKVVDMPTYRDGGPRIRYIKKKILPSPGHQRLPPHLHVAKYPAGAFPTHSHEYHHHPSHDAKYYGYIPGIPGKPWKDYPLYSHVPLTGFSCKLTKYPGFYADVDAGCQVCVSLLVLALHSYTSMTG